MTVAEPVRDDDPVHPYLELVACPDCPNGPRPRTRADGQTVNRRCRTCRGTPGRVLAGHPDGSRYCISYDFTGRQA
jgi:hypothetical protein